MDKETLYLINLQVQLPAARAPIFKLSYWANKHNISFSKAIFFILGLVFSHSFVENTMVSSMMDYLRELGHSLPKAAAIVNVQEGLSVFCALLIAHIADTCTGRFKAIAYATASLIAGLVLWGLANWFFDSSTKAGVIFLVMLLVMVGKGSKDPTLKAFLRDQLVHHEDQAEGSGMQFWWRLASALGTIASVILSMVYLGTISVITAFAITALGVAYLTFWSGFCFYHLESPKGSPLVIIYRVFKAAVLKHHKSFPDDPNDYHDQSVCIDPQALSTDIKCLRWLNKAAIIESSPTFEVQLQKGRLCSLSDVRRVKGLLTLVPMWTTLVVYGLVDATGSTFFVEQSDKLNGVVPINAFFLLESLVSFIVPYIYNRSIAKWWRKPTQQAMLLRIGVGMAVSILCCLLAWQVEVHRLNLIDRYGTREDLPMSIFWLAPQFFGLGVMDGLVLEGLSEFYYRHADESMKLYESPFNDCVVSIGKLLSAILVSGLNGSWFSDNINSSHLDKYFLFLACLSSLNLCFYGYVAYKYECCEPSGVDGKHEDLEAGHAYSTDKNLPCVNGAPEVGVADSTVVTSKGTKQSLSFSLSRQASHRRIVPVGSKTFT